MAPRRATRKPQGDFLDELIEEGARRNPRFRQMVDTAYRRRRLLDRLVRIRQGSALTQADVARRMDTSQAEVARIESGEVDLRGSTLERYAFALGRAIDYRLTPIRRLRASREKSA